MKTLKEKQNNKKVKNKNTPDWLKGSLHHCRGATCLLSPCWFWFQLKSDPGLKRLSEAIITVKLHYGKTNIYKHGACAC